MAKFKVGDRVRVKEGGHYYGKCRDFVGTLYEVGKAPVVDFGEGFDGWMAEGHPSMMLWCVEEEDLELIPAATTPTLKPGARVRLLKDDNRDDDAYRSGDIVRVRDVSIYFEDRDGDVRTLPFASVELVTTPPYEEDLADIRAELAKRDQTYKVGDAVLWNGEVAVVASVPDNDNTFLLETKRGAYGALGSELQPLAA